MTLADKFLSSQNIRSFISLQRSPAPVAKSSIVLKAREYLKRCMAMDVGVVWTLLASLRASVRRQSLDDRSFEKRRWT